ncbi:MAG: DUF3179 domain-containing protein [Planctomycetes bacterium]|nr:DUF3179 domain-containing protein [Planctomycetota bacterium]
MSKRGNRTVALVVATVALVVALACGSLAVLRGLRQQDGSDFDQDVRRAVSRDGFPVFNNPPMVSAGQAAGLRDDDWVIGVTVNRQAKAYPITEMCFHELGNDTCGGEPIAVSW